jgi:hypothetical protein
MIENIKMQGKNTIYARRLFKQKIILIRYENEGYDRKRYQNWC